jgi:hypothetical protein
VGSAVSVGLVGSAVGSGVSVGDALVAVDVGGGVCVAGICVSAAASEMKTGVVVGNVAGDPPQPERVNNKKAIIMNLVLDINCFPKTKGVKLGISGKYCD